MLRRLPLALLALALGEPLAAQTVVGRLVDQASQQPVPAGTVQLLAADSTQVGVVLTDAAGAFQLPAPAPGRYFLTALAPGYSAVETDLFSLGAGEFRVRFDIPRAALPVGTVSITGPPVSRLDTGSVAQAPLRLDTVSVTTARAVDRRFGGFYQRMRDGTPGRFFPREDIERFRPINMGDLLRRVPSLEVQIGVGDFGDSRTLRVRLREPLSFRSPCWSLFYLDGMRVDAEAIDNLEPSDVEAVEVYTREAVPAQFSSSYASSCGVIAVWRRLP